MRVRTGAAVGAAAAIVALVGMAMLDDGGERVGEESVFRVVLADPDLYASDGTYSQDFGFDRGGEYRFRFTPNGDSPEILSIRIQGESFSFEEDFELSGILHQTGISEYYTWEYLGRGVIQVPDPQQVRITIDPHGNLLGAVTVNLLRE